VLPQQFDVGDQVLSRVVGQVNRGIAGMGRAEAAAALIEGDDAVQLWVERPSHPRHASRPWTAVHEQRGCAVGIS
jgi:hypothetical protein